MSDGHGHFIIPAKYYIGTCASLIFLTIVTVASAQIDLGFLNVPLAMILATTKMLLVVMFFMGMRWEKGIIPIFFFSSVVGVFLFFIFTYADIGYRDIVDPIEAETFGTQSKVIKVEPGSESSHH